MALFSRRNIRSNPYGITELDLKGKVADFPIGVVVRMWEEAKRQYENYTIEKFLKDIEKSLTSVFVFDGTEGGWSFWHRVLDREDFDLFFDKYPEYERYNLA